MQDARLERGVAGVLDDLEARLRPRAVERPRRLHRADDVVAPLHDRRGDLADLVDAGEELAPFQPRAVDEVVALDAREGERELRLPGLLDERGHGKQIARAP